MKLLVGLGNPGKEYKYTKHNAGFLVIDKILEKMNLTLNKEKFNGEFCVADDLIIAKPMTYMNNSGEFIQAISKYFKISSSDIMVIYDEKDFDIGQAAIKVGGSSGGHNGVKSVEQHLGVNDFKKMRIGIGHSKLVPLRDYVLSKFTKAQIIEFEKVSDLAADAAVSFVYNDIRIVMDKFNVNRKK